MREILEDLGDGNDPTRQVQKGMRQQLPKRFYETAIAGPADGGHGVFLDGKPVRTPARSLFILPTASAASLVAAEFAAQKTEINPSLMPLTRLANTILDGIVPDPQPVAEDIMRFAATDLVCYRASAPQELVALQAQAWDPVVDWYRDAHGANFMLAQGVMHVAQPREALAVFGTLVRRHSDAFKLGCLHTVTSLTGSALLAIAMAEGFIDAGEAWRCARVDEEWNRRQWGDDAEAVSREAFRKTEMLAAAEMWNALH